MNGEKQQRKSFDWLKQYQWQKGQSGNPAGRPKTKTLKEFARDYLSQMSDEARIEYFEQLDPDLVWRMAEGQPSTEGKIELDLPTTLVELIKHGTSNKGGNS